VAGIGGKVTTILHSYYIEDGHKNPIWQTLFDNPQNMQVDIDMGTLTTPLNSADFRNTDTKTDVNYNSTMAMGLLRGWQMGTY